MHLVISHKFGSATLAKERVMAALADAKPTLAGKGEIDKEEWSGNTLTFMVSGQGQQISGTLEVTDTQFILDATLPLMLRMFEGRIEQMIESQANNLLK